MNFIRFVKTPRIGPAPTRKSSTKSNIKKSTSQQLSMILTITTDFSPFAGSIELLCQLLSPNESVVAEERIKWSEIHRELKVEFPVPSTFREGRVVVRPVDQQVDSREFTFLSQFLRPGFCENHIVGVETGQFCANAVTPHDTVYRRFQIAGGSV